MSRLSLRSPWHGDDFLPGPNLSCWSAVTQEEETQRRIGADPLVASLFTMVQ